MQEPIEQIENQTEGTPLDYEPMDSEDPLVTPDKQTPRRVITDTGDIVEEPMLFKTDAQIVTGTLDLGNIVYTYFIIYNIVCKAICDSLLLKIGSLI